MLANGFHGTEDLQEERVSGPWSMRILRGFLATEVGFAGGAIAYDEEDERCRSVSTLDPGEA